MRLLIVSNRLPVTAAVHEGNLTFAESAGGLVSGLRTYLNSLETSSFAQSEFAWVGWPGITVDPSLQESLKSELSTRFRAIPVNLPEEAMEKFYHGFCNKTIWGLFHYFPSHVVYSEEYWKQYEHVNQAFSEAVLRLIKQDDVVWIHDYHLMLLPQMLREKIPEIPIGFFLHIPFPSFEIFRLLPGQWRARILEGILGADLVGFHTHDYTQYFLRCVSRILGYEHNLGKVHLKDRMVKADTFPMGIDFKKFQQALQDPEAKKEREGLMKTFAGWKVILSIDRLDYSKGIINRLRGYGLFLKNHPEWRGKVVMAAVVVPSRIGVEHYQQMKKEIDETVGEVNGQFGNLNWTPILYQYKSLPFQQLAPLYTVSDIALVTPLRDGMNLIAKEYVASRTDKTGVLILSEMAGASKELGEAIIINPNHIVDIESAILEALEMPREEQIKRNQNMQTRLKRYDVVRWANDFIQSLRFFKEEYNKFNMRTLDPDEKEQIFHDLLKDQLFVDFGNARRKLILLDYDGTLVPYSLQPQMARPDERLLRILKSLSEDHGTDLVLMSGREKTTLENWFGSIRMGLVAEHGMWVREREQDWIMLKPLSSEWKHEILPLLETYADRLPGAFVEEKQFSVAWHYRKADPDLAQRRSQELMDDLVEFTANMPIQILQGSKVLEVRSAGVDKGTACNHWVAKTDFDFIMAIGDDWTDEDLFKVLPEKAYTIRVGMTPTYAKFNVRDSGDVHKLLDKMSSIGKYVR